MSRPVCMKVVLPNFKWKIRSPEPTRWLAALLLYVLASGATLGVIHKHGNVAPANTPTQGVCLKEKSGGNYDALPTDTCSMCQFQRNLSGGLIAAPQLLLPDVLPDASPGHFAPLYQPLYLAYLRSSIRGRAPPFAILL